MPEALRRLGTRCLPLRLLQFGWLGSVCLLAGCDHRQPLGGGFELCQAANWNPDGHPGIRLYYHRHEIWGAVAWGEGGPEKNLHGDIFVFEAVLSSDDSSLPLAVASTNAPASKPSVAYGARLFAVRGAGPPTLISPLIFSEKADGPHSYEVLRSSATDSAVTAVFRYWPDEDHASERTNSVSWQTISNWLARAETTGKLQKSPEGTYRVLEP